MTMFYFNLPTDWIEIDDMTVPDIVVMMTDLVINRRLWALIHPIYNRLIHSI